MGTLQEIKRFLYARNWKKVIEIFSVYPSLYSTKITKSEDTILHLAATHGADNTLVQLLDAMEKIDPDLNTTRKALQAKNKQGDTPLHCAAARSSSAIMCERILSIDQELVVDRNYERETPLFLAALHGHKETFLLLHSASELLQSTNMYYKHMKVTPPWRKKGGETILHCTIQREYFDLAFDIIHLYGEQFIASSIDEQGITPLHVLVNKPSAFESGTRLGWWTKIIYYCMVVEPLKAPTDSEVRVEIEPRQDKSQGRILLDKAELPDNYHTCHDFFEFLWDLVRSVTWKEGIGRSSETEVRNSTSYENSYFPLNYATCFEFFKSSYMHIFGLSGFGLMSIKKLKQKHVWCAQIINELIKQNLEYEWTDGGSDPSMDQLGEEELQESILNLMRNKPKIDSSHPGSTNANVDQQQEDAQQEEIGKSTTALLMAAKNGVIEMVRRILEDFPMAILDRTKVKKNILHVAVENRQPHIFMELKKHDLWGSLIEEVDVHGNNVLHLAAKVSKYKPWQIPGSAMQMQWEIKWYQYVKKAVEPQAQHLIFQTNEYDKTPEEIFNESHKDLLQDGGEWLKSTCNSYSVVAVLIAGISFATSTNVPGGTNDQTGKSPLEGQLAFNVFAISSMVALSFSITQLVMLLAILTSRQQPKDFRRDLPFKLLLGLTSLFVSIASTLVSFCAAYFFVLKDKLSTGVYVVYTATCLPVSFYAITQFPLYLDLLQAIFTEVPQPSYKDDDL